MGLCMVEARAIVVEMFVLVLKNHGKNKCIELLIKNHIPMRTSININKSCYARSNDKNDVFFIFGNVSVSVYPVGVHVRSAPESLLRFVVDTDASKYGVGAFLAYPSGEGISDSDLDIIACYSDRISISRRHF